MLSDAQIERWSRQILVADVGGRGQERLCAARVEVVGSAGPAAFTAELIERAGPPVRLVDRPSGTADVVVVWATNAWRDTAGVGEETVPVTVQRRVSPLAVLGDVRGAAAVVTAVTSAPCVACVAAPASELDGSSADAPLARVATRAAAALAASEVVRLLVVPGAGGRTHRLDLAAGVFTADAARAGADCPVCGGTA